MKRMITVTGVNYRYGVDIFEKGMRLKLVKEPTNEYDSEAIKVTLPGLGKVGYVANSVETVCGETMSAGRLYDHIGKKAEAKVVFILPNALICKVVS